MLQETIPRWLPICRNVRPPPNQVATYPPEWVVQVVRNIHLAYCTSWTQSNASESLTHIGEADQSRKEVLICESSEADVYHL